MAHKGNCREVFALLSEYLDGELDAATYDEIERHLSGCPPCIEFLRSLRRSIGLCQSCQPAETPPPLKPEERDQLRAAYARALSKKA